jgi:hypothetical protein
MNSTSELQTKNFQLLGTRHKTNSPKETNSAEVLKLSRKGKAQSPEKQTHVRHSRHCTENVTSKETQQKTHFTVPSADQKQKVKQKTADS